MEPVMKATGGSGLPGIVELFSSAWKIFRERWKVLLGLGFLPVIITLPLMFLSGDPVPFINQADVSVGILVLVIVLGLVAVVVSMTSSAAQIVVAGNQRHIPFGEAFRWGLSRVVSMIRLGILQVLLAVLLLFPALLVWFSFFFGTLGVASLASWALMLSVVLPFIVIFVFLILRLAFSWALVALNEAAVLESFKKSWQLTRGRFWALLGRVAAAVALSGVINVVLGFLPVVGALFQVVVSAYFIVYFILLFRATQHMAGGVPTILAAPVASAVS